VTADFENKVFEMARYFLLLPIAAYMMVGSPALADVTVQITGTLAQNACTPNLQRSMNHYSGGGSFNGSTVVTLPTVNVSALNQAGKVYGNTILQFVATGCTGNVNSMWVHFTAPNVDSNGRIVPTNGTNRVRFEFFNNSFGGSRIAVGGVAGSQPGTHQGTAVLFSGSHPANSVRVATKNYGVRYYAQWALDNGVAGNVSTPVTANFKYY